MSKLGAMDGVFFCILAALPLWIFSCPRIGSRFKIGFSVLLVVALIGCGGAYPWIFPLIAIGLFFFVPFVLPFAAWLLLWWWIARFTDANANETTPPILIAVLGSLGTAAAGALILSAFSS